MGALHEGHAQLARTAVEQNDVVVASIFVNPLQFGEAVDLDRYPRTLDADMALLEEQGVDLVFAPSVDEVYPGGEPLVRVTAGTLGDKWEGASRPGHFDGALTVVAKLLHYGIPGTGLPRGAGAFVTGAGGGLPAYRAYFGQKDAQQLALVRRMVADLNFPRARSSQCPPSVPETGWPCPAATASSPGRSARPPWCCRGRCGFLRTGRTPTSRSIWSRPGRSLNPSRWWNWTTSTWWTPGRWNRWPRTAGRPRSAAKAWRSSRPGWVPVRLIDNVPLSS